MLHTLSFLGTLTYLGAAGYGEFAGTRVPFGLGEDWGFCLGGIAVGEQTWRLRRYDITSYNGVMLLALSIATTIELRREIYVFFS
jgi:hypothetical protein